jgi:hypothetical protein
MKQKNRRFFRGLFSIFEAPSGTLSGERTQAFVADDVIYRVSLTVLERRECHLSRVVPSVLEKKGFYDLLFLFLV